MPAQSYLPEALRILRTKFAAAQRYPLNEYEEIAERTGESVERVQAWFSNKRQAERQAQKVKVKTPYCKAKAEPKPAFGVGGLALPSHGATNRKRLHHSQSAEARFGSRAKQQRRAPQQWYLADGSLNLEVMHICAKLLCEELQAEGSLAEGTAPSAGTICKRWQALGKNMNADEPVGYPGGFVTLMAAIGRSTSQLRRQELGKAGHVNIAGEVVSATQLATQIQAFRRKYAPLDPELATCFPRVSHTDYSLEKKDRGLTQALRSFCQAADLSVEEFAKVIQVMFCFVVLVV